MKKNNFDNTLGSCLKEYWTNYVGWGRATRSEYWWSYLFYTIIATWVLLFVPVINVLWLLATLVPSFTLTARRLHDTNRSNWNVLWLLLPVVGVIILIVFLCMESDKKSNNFGEPRI